MSDCSSHRGQARLGESKGFCEGSWVTATTHRSIVAARSWVAFIVLWRPMANSLISDIAESMLPWGLTPTGLNANENEELALRRSLGPTLERTKMYVIKSKLPVTNARANGTVVTHEEDNIDFALLYWDTQKRNGYQMLTPRPVKPTTGETMGKYANVARRAAEATQKYAPAVVSTVNSTLAAVTGGKVATAEEVSSYVGNNPARLKVTTEAMLRAGINMGDVIPRDLIGNDKNMMAIRTSAERLVATLQQRFEAGSDKTLDQGVDNAVADLMRRKRVEAVRGIYGNEAAYFLCHPNGGVPPSDFAWYDTVIRGRR